MARRRNYIPLPEKLASALACLLPQATRDDLRNRKVPAIDVLSLFQWDHIVLHSFGGSDDWHNLTPMLTAEHREKSKIDTKIAAKTKRINKRWLEFMRNISNHKKTSKKPSRWPKRKFRQQH